MSLPKGTKVNVKKPFFSRIISANTRPLQIELLKEANQKFKYQSDLSNGFNIHLCGRCHSLYQRRAKREQQDLVQQLTVPTDNTPLAENVSLDENASLTEKTPLNNILLPSDTEDITQINTLLVVSPFKGMKYPAKNVTFHSFEIEELTNFRLRVLQEVRALLENIRIISKDLILSYRITKMGIGTAIYDNNDYQKFLSQYRLLQASPTKKEMTITVTLKKSLKKRNVSDD